MSYQKKVGNFGQKQAKDFLIKRGFQVVSENYCIRGGELDLIAIKDNEIVFVEVKTRTSDQFGNPEDSISRYQQKAINRTIRVFLHKKYLYRDYYPRFDIISVVIDKDSKKVFIKHFQDIILNIV